MIKNINLDIKDDYINDIKSICKDLSKAKKDKIIKIVKELAEY